jgi:hypothetical protein
VRFKMHRMVQLDAGCTFDLAQAIPWFRSDFIGSMRWYLINGLGFFCYLVASELLILGHVRLGRKPAGENRDAGHHYTAHRSSTHPTISLQPRAEPAPSHLSGPPTTFSTVVVNVHLIAITLPASRALNHRVREPCAFELQPPYKRSDNLCTIPVSKPTSKQSPPIEPSSQ